MLPSDRIPYRRLFPWLHLFDAIGLSLSIRQLLVASGAVLALQLGQTVFEWTESAEPRVNWNIDIQIVPVGHPEFPKEVIREIGAPWLSLIEAARAIRVPDDNFRSRFNRAALGAWSMAVWSLFGLALCRLATRRFARRESGSFRKAIQFAVSRWFRAIAAPLLPSAAALIILIGAIVVSFPARTPLIGQALAVVIAPIVVVCGLFVAYLVIAVLLGWPLMIAAIATDDCDGFGGLSRSYSMWTGRLWYFVWCWLVAAAAGVFALSVANILVSWTIHYSGITIRYGMGESSAFQVTGATCLLMTSFVSRIYAISFFWTATTIVYALLRQNVDGIPLDQSAPDDDEKPPRDPLPVVGMPAMR